MQRARSAHSTKTRRPPLAGALLLAVLVALAGSAVPQSATAQNPKAQKAQNQKAQGPKVQPTPTQWWNDPEIVRELALSDAQRSKMDAAYDVYARKLKDARKNRDAQRGFFDALTTGQWDRGKTDLDEWVQQSTIPIEAMGQLKLEILPLLSEEQREKLLDSYPRVLRRQWRPTVRWANQGNPGLHQKKKSGAGAGGPKK